jgi:glycosyltransferase involved in cell wall biosynthesis
MGRPPAPRPPRILIVGMVDSIHVARWIAHFAGSGLDLHLFPERDTGAEPTLAGITLWQIEPFIREDPGRDIHCRDPLSPAERAGVRAGRIPERAAVLARLIRRLAPDAVHVMEYQHAGYLTLEAFDRLPPRDRPPLISSCFGSDLYLFGRLPEHQERLRALMRATAVHHCECARDLAIGRRLGFAGIDAPCMPIGGGWDLDAAAIQRRSGPSSRRRIISLKGYEHWAGRARLALEGIRRVAPLLDGYTVEIYRCGDGLWNCAEVIGAETGISFVRQSTLAGELAYEEILAMHGRSRIALGLSISDGIGTSMLEAMMMGAFPIQSNTCCGDEWIESGVNGLLVPPEDPAAVAEALALALSDDALVDGAAEINARIARERLDINFTRERAHEIYRLALDGAAGSRRCAS